MLQQTRVETVQRYYERFLDRFPDVAALARADHEEVLKHWEGLGYYRRVLNLHRAAQGLADQGLDIPATATELRSLQGVGDYTAAAIASIAFGEPAAAVDGNVARVIARLFQIEDDVLLRAGKTHIAAMAQQLIPTDRPGDFNQAWMDLASLVCLPRSPKCSSCPLVTKCRANREGITDRLPVRGSANGRTVPMVRIVVALFRRGRHILMRKRPEGGLWSGLWEPPNAAQAGRSMAAALRGIIKVTGLPDDLVSRKLPVVEHHLTHRRLLLRPVLVEVDKGIRAQEREKVRWLTRTGLAEIPVPTAFRKVLRAADRQTS